MMKCLACGSELTTYEYQARAADEAQRSVTTCMKCPLDALRLDISSVPRPSHTHLGAFTRTQAKPIRFKSQQYGTVYVMVIKMDTSKVTATDEARCTNIIDDQEYLFKYYTTGPFAGMCLHKHSVKLAGPCVNIIEYKTAFIEINASSTYIDFLYSESTTDNNMYVITGAKDAMQAISVLGTTYNDNIYSTMEMMYTRHIMNMRLTDCIPKTMLDGMSNLSARAYDAPSASEDEYTFSTKVDGERLWLSRIGNVWVYSRRLVGHAIIGWDVDPTVDVNDRLPYGPVLDVEMLIGHPPVLIDILMKDDCSLPPRDRNIDWIYHEFDDLCIEYTYLRSIFKREMRSTYQEAQRDCDNALYPTDGIVALPHSGIDMIKLKSIKSTELILAERGILKTCDGVSLFKVRHYSRYEIGAIYEIGISFNKEKCTIHHMHRRTDKIKGNSVEAFKSIVESAFEKSPDGALRTSLWRWSNDIRGEIYKRAFDILPGKRIILDIGTGDGQSTDAHLKSSICSFILVEKDKNKCKSLQRRLGIKHYETNPRSLIRHMGSLKTGRSRYTIINCSLEDILHDDTVTAMILPELKCAVACFSTQFIISSLTALKKSGVPFLGTCYTYDDLDIGESIINTGGISMTKTAEDSATVTWGKDTSYNEPAIETDDFPSGFAIMNASTIVAFPVKQSISHALSITRHLKVIMSQ